MKKSIYHHIREAYPIDAPTLEQVTAVILEHAPSISSPDLTFEELSINIYQNFIAWKQ